MDEVQALQQPPQPEKAHPSNYKLFLIIIAVLLLLVGLLAGFLLASNKNSQTQQLAVVSPTAMMKLSPTAIPSPTIDETANWKTYTSKQNIYSIKYPLDTFVRLICPGEELTLQKRATETQESVTMPTCARGGRYDIEVVNLTQPFIEPKSDENYSVVKESITVAGVPAMRYTTSLIKAPEGPSINFSQDVYVTHNGKTYLLHVGNESLLPIFNKMLATFKFLN